MLFADLSVSSQPLMGHDVVRLSVASILITFIFLSMNTQNAYANEGLDYSFGAGMRSLPKGASLSAELGYGRVLWGDSSSGEVFYGYVRPVTRVTTSVLVNAAEAELQLAPVSFLIFSAGAALSQRKVDSATIDCSQYDCRGALGSQYLDANLLLGAGPWAGVLEFRVDWMRPLNPNSPQADFADENSVLVGKRDGDRLVTQKLYLVYRPLENWRFGGFISKQQMTISSTSNQTQGLFTRLTSNPWAYTVGLNLYESSTQVRSPGLFVAVSRTGIPSIGLH
jgi:hypothetical protein